MPVFKRDIVLNDGTTIWLRKDSGIVESVKDWSETRISSYGGGGYVQGGTGTVSAPIVRASNIHRQVFFLKRDDGTQNECSTNLINVAVGHHVTEVMGAAASKDYGHVLGYYNHTTGSYAFYGNNDYAMEDFDQYRLGCMPFTLYLGFLFVSFFVLAFKQAASHTTEYTNVMVGLLILFVVSIPASVIIYLRRRWHLPKFHQDLVSRALAFMREG